MSLEDVVQGFSSAAGAQDVVNRIQGAKDDRQATAREELHAQTRSILDDIAHIQQRKASLDPKSPTYQQDAAMADSDLAKTQQTFHDLYHPAINPGAIQHLGSILWQHLGGQKPVAANPAEAKQSLQQGIAAAHSAAATPVAAPNPILQKRQQMQAAGMTPEQISKVEQIDSGLLPHADKEKQGKYFSQMADMQDPTGAHTYYRVPMEEGAGPEKIAFPEGQAMVPKVGASGHSKFSQEAGVYEKQWGKPIANWTPEELSYFNQKMAYDAARSGQSTTTKLEKDQQGNIHPIEITSQRGPTNPPVDPHGRMTPGAAKRMVAPGAPGPGAPRSNIREGAPLSFRSLTPAVTKAQSDFNDATKLAKTADLVAQHPDDAVNQKRLAVALERASAGRFTTVALDYIVKAGWGNTIEGWANSATTGALPTAVLKQLVDGAHENLIASKAALDNATGATDGATPPAAGPTTQPSSAPKEVSLAKARQLPAMQGKNDEQIKAAIIASGRKVKP